MRVRLPPRAPPELLEVEPLFLSIVGDQASGKSFFLTAMVQQLREVLFHRFRVKFEDADPAANRVLTGYIESLFGRADDQSPVPLGDLIPKTPMGGTCTCRSGSGTGHLLPAAVRLLGTAVAGHPASVAGERLSRMLCVYDNAGEHFRPGGNR